MAKNKKQIIERLNRTCVYCGGHYFGKILNDDKKEYWECPKCYWGK